MLLEEAERQFPGQQNFRILSIGTGLRDDVSIGKTRREIIKALKKMATSSKKVAMSLETRFGGSGQYHRFNVSQGLQDVTLSDWEKTSEISAHTANYLSENRRSIQEFVDSFFLTADNASRISQFEGSRVNVVQTQMPSTAAAAAAESTATVAEPVTASKSQYTRNSPHQESD